MKHNFLIAILLLLLIPQVFAEGSLSGAITSQAEVFLHRLTVGPSTTQYVTSSDFANSSELQKIAPGISPENVCMSLGTFRSDPDWLLGTNGESIRYAGSKDQGLEFFVFCEKGSKLLQAAQFFPGNKISEKFMAHCPQVDSENEQQACIIVLSKYSPVAPDGFSIAYQVFFIFAVLAILPLLFLFRADDLNLKLLNLIKLVFLVSMFVVFYFLGFILSVMAMVLLLFFFFVQINLSLAPIVLGLHQNEAPIVRLMLKAVLVMEAIGLFIALLLISPFI
ncbi:MAG: hypothetical protein NUV67_00970 [archaeon]|nr:hypothetical protein [archaeon]